MKSESHIIGIDLGTTNSVVAVAMGADPVVIPNSEGSNKTPSVVAFLENGDVIVGEIARRQAATNASRTISSVKRLMGRNLEDIQEAGDLFTYQLVQHEGQLLVDVDGMGYKPEQISALILKKLKESAESYLGTDVTQAVITVPAYFDDSQRQATIDAAGMAGLDVLRLINEPTAAAMAYGLGRTNQEDEVVAVYDFGGGTFDVSLLEISEKTFEVLTSTGDSHLGGDDLDAAIVNMIVDEFVDEYGVDLTQDPVTLRRLKEVAERAKCELSTTNQTSVALPFIAYQNGQPLHLDRVLRRDEFEDLIDDFVRRTIRCCKRALEEAGLTKKDINRVILVGGTTRIPLVQDSVEEFFDQQSFRGVNPDEVVALGAATQAGVFEGNVQEVVLLDVTPHSLGIEVEGGKFSRIIDKNSTIPIKAAKTFTTTEENQAFVNIHILQGESDEAAENRSLGKFSLTGIPPAAAGVPRVRVTFFINSDGVMEISAEDMHTGQAQAMTIVHSNLTEEERNKRQRRRTRKGEGGGRTTRAGGRRSGAGKGGRAKGSGLATRGDFSSTGGVSSQRQSGARIPTQGGISGPTPVEGLPGSSPALPVSAEGRTSGAAPAQGMADSGAKDPPSFAVLGDAKPAEMKRSGRYRDGTSSSPLVPVDYSKAPPMYSHMEESEEGRPPTGNLPSPVGAGGASKARGPVNPAAAIPTTTEDSSKMAGVGGGVRAAKGEPPLNKGEEAPDFPYEIREALALARQGSENATSQKVYAIALEVLTLPPWDKSTNFSVMQARFNLHLMAGQLEETRKVLSQLRAEFLNVMPEDILSLHDRAHERFNAASILRDRSAARAALGDLVGASADLEQATRQDPIASDAAELRKLYKARSGGGQDPQAQFKLVKILLKSNEVDEAIEVLQELQKHAGYEARALKILGLCHWQKNMHYLAWQKFKTLPVDEDLKDILYRLAGDMEASDQIHNAVSVLEHLEAEAPAYRDVEARLRKLAYRLKLQRDEQEQSAASVPMLSRDSRFTILEEINRGSMGIIYKAQDKTLNEIVALKVLNDYLCSDPAAVERFKSEARAAKKLSHPYIVRIHDLFEVDNKRYISMEFIEGADLKRLISERTTFTEEMILYYFKQICDALSYAHKLGIVHRDIKPANIMITSRNSVKITDFGIAKILRGDEATKSGTAVIGTPLYMAPEQIIGEPVDGRTDIYSLGIMMYEMLTGNPPFYLGNIEYHHIHTAPPPMGDKTSSPIRDVIMKMISKKPADRFQTVDEVLTAIRGT
jgi:molecular chaperone DnaK